VIEEGREESELVDCDEREDATSFAKVSISEFMVECCG
jgi:hypothetical protein